MPPTRATLLMQFIVTGRGMGGSRAGGMPPAAPPLATDSFLAPIIAASRAKRRPSSPPPAMWPLLRKRRRKKKAVENAGPGRQRRQIVSEAPERPEDWRAKVKAAAWAARDWWTLKALGEIDEVPEP